LSNYTWIAETQQQLQAKTNLIKARMSTAI